MVYKCRNGWHEIRNELRDIANIWEISAIVYVNVNPNKRELGEP